MTIDSAKFGNKDSSYLAAGQLAGLNKLTQEFYRIMETREEMAPIREMHGDDLELASDKLASFLSGWLGGPRYYQERFGPIHIPRKHAQFPIGELERDLWLQCMSEAVDAQDYPDEFKIYLMDQFKIPAQRIFEKCSAPSPASLLDLI